MMKIATLICSSFYFCGQSHRVDCVYHLDYGFGNVNEILSDESVSENVNETCFSNAKIIPN